MAKGVPTARSQSYKAIQKLQGKKPSTPTTSGNDVFPSPLIIPAKPTTQAEGAQRAFTTVRVLHQSLLHAMSPGDHIYDMLQLMGPYLYDCSQWFDEEQARSAALQRQLDAANSKLLEQASTHEAQLFALQSLLTKSQDAQEFYRRQALQVDMVPPRRRHRFVSSETDDALTHEQLRQQLYLAREDIQVRDRALARCQLKQTTLENSIEQTLTSSADSLALHVRLFEQHLDLHVRHQACQSSLVRVQTQLSECQARVQQTESLLEEACNKYAKLTNQVDKEDQILRCVIDYRVKVSIGYGVYGTSEELPMVEHILDSRPHLRPTGRIRSRS